MRDDERRKQGFIASDTFFSIRENYAYAGLVNLNLNRYGLSQVVVGQIYTWGIWVCHSKWVLPDWFESHSSQLVMLRTSVDTLCTKTLPLS